MIPRPSTAARASSPCETDVVIPSTQQSPGLFHFFPLILLPLLAFHLYHAFTRRADPDEFQTILNAIDFYRGQILYVDYWDNHGPLMTWLAAPIAALADSLQHQLFYAARAAMFLNTLIVLSLTWLLARLAFPAVTTAPPLAVLLLAASPTSLQKSIEFRPDNPTTALFLAGLYLLLSALEKPKPWRLAAAGFLLALISGFTLKVLILGAATVLALTTIFVIRRQPPPFRQFIPFLTGGAGAIAAIALLLIVTGSMPGFIPCYLGGNIDRDHDFTIQEFLDIYERATAWAIILTIGSLAPLLHSPTRRRYPLATGLSAAALFLYLQFALLLPTKHLQSLLPAHPLAAVAASGIFARALTSLQTTTIPRRRYILIASLSALALLALFDLYRLNRKSPPRLAAELRFANSVAARLQPDQLIFDPSGIVFLQPRPGPFHVLVTFIRDLYRDGRIDLHIPALLDQSHAVIGDRRTYDLPRQDLELLQRQFRLTHSTRKIHLYEKSPTPSTPPALQEALEKSQPRKTSAAPPPSWYTTFIAIHKANQSHPHP